MTRIRRRLAWGHQENGKLYLVWEAFAMYRQMLAPDSSQLILKLPMRFVGRLVEVLAFTVESDDAKEEKYSWENAREFFRAHRVSMNER